jgi:multidrug efflux pump subunit AcrA (membrane-fusion protein)
MWRKLNRKVNMMKSKMKFLLAGAAFSFLLAACGTPAPAPAAEASPVPASSVIAEGNIRPARVSNLSFQARGVVEKVSVRIGDQVRAGDELLRLANAGQAEAQVVSARNAYELLLRDEAGARARLRQAYLVAQEARGRAEKKWEDLNVEDIEDRIEEAEDEVEDRRLDLEREREDFDKVKDLGEEDDKRQEAEDDLETAQENLNESLRDLESTIREKEQVRAAYDAALAAEVEAKYQYEISLDGPNADQLALARAQLDSAQDALDAYVITAPFDGRVAEVGVTLGEQVGPETRAVSLVDDSSWIVETSDLTELEVVRIAEGQRVAIAVDALPEIALEGTVSEISQASILQSGDVIYTVRIRVEQVDPRIRWGMTVEAVFTGAEE